MFLEYFLLCPSCCIQMLPQWNCCILLTFQRRGLLPIRQWDSWVTCSFPGVFSQAESLALQDMSFPRHKHGKRGQWGEKWTYGSFWYSTVRFSLRFKIFCDSTSLTGSRFQMRKGFMNVACMHDWAWKDTSVCRGQYGDEARLGEKHVLVEKCVQMVKCPLTRSVWVLL